MIPDSNLKVPLYAVMYAMFIHDVSHQALL